MASEWISVNDRLPAPEDNPVMGYVAEFKLVQMVWYHSLSKRWETPSGFGLQITHWMPLPEPPKEGE